MRKLSKDLIEIISETNGISLEDTLELAINSKTSEKNKILEFQDLLFQYNQDKVDINKLFDHEVGKALFDILKKFPIPYREEHIHLTGSLSAEFIYPRLKKILEGKDKDIYINKLKEVYPNFKGVSSIKDVKDLIVLKDDEQFDRYLQILLPPKLILTDKKSHIDAAYHMAKDLYEKYNVGMIRLKFTLSRATNSSSEQIPGIEDLTEEDVVLGLYEGFMKFKKEMKSFEFVLSPSFRKETNHFDSNKFETKSDHINDQVNIILNLLEKHPQLEGKLKDVDTVGNEKDLFRKIHFLDLKRGLRRLQYKGFFIRSHHGETWHTLRRGVQAVDNAMNIWHIDTLEHGISLGINPNYYFHSLYLRVWEKNQKSEPIEHNSNDYNELIDMDWSGHDQILEKLIIGSPISDKEKIQFIKIKFHTAREIEHYQHDVLNRMINKKVSLIALPSSNKKLTGCFQDYKDHPFSWWEKKGVKLGIGTDNYITLGTNYIKELLISLFSDPKNLKITKLLMVATGENRRPYISQYLWKMREKYQDS